MMHIPFFRRRLSPLLREYERYRALQIALHTRLTKEYVQSEQADEAAQFLDLWENIDGERTMVFESEQEGTAFSDFLLYEWPDESGLTVVRRAVSDGTLRATDEERKFLPAMAESQTLFLEVRETDPSAGVLRMADLGTEEGIEIVNRNFSLTAQVGLLYFGHVTSLTHFRMMTGAGFLFPPEKKEMLMRRYRRAGDGAADANDRSLLLWKHFFELNRRHGLETTVL